MAKERANFNVFPLWKFLQDEFGFDESFHVFGPFLGASIRPRTIDPCTIEVFMPLVLNNTNYVGTHFGGSLYSMCDPWYMAILIRNLGPDYIVWDKSARIEFVRPGRGTVSAQFHVSPEEMAEIKEIVAKDRKTIRHYNTRVVDENNQVVALVEKEIYIRRKMGSTA
ncbi:MAG: YiiD C-terminal domain-containing protein [Spirochaetales bacterium]|nr:YiiD C-terminal domain-containing protein [Spirochaetales bacterium]